MRSSLTNPLQRIGLFGPFLLTLAAALSACSTPDPVPTPEPPQAQVATALPAPTSRPTPSPSPTAQPALVVLIVPPEAEPSLVEEIRSSLDELAAQGGWHLETHAHLAPGEVTPQMRVVLALPPDPGLAELARTAPDAQFVAIGIPGLEASANLSLIGPDGLRPDRQGFLAGYLAAVITPEWRVGVLSVGDLTAGRAARQGFLNGAIFFCGLCRPTHPPYHPYPLTAEVSSAAGPGEWQAAADALLENSVRTLYLGPGAVDDSLLAHLDEAGVNWIATGLPVPKSHTHLVALVRPSPAEAIRALWPDLLAGQGGASVPMPISLDQVNSDLFSPGRQRLVQALIPDLLEGSVDTGVDPLTGEPR